MKRLPLVLCSLLAACSTPEPAPTGADATNARASVPAAVHRSVLPPKSAAGELADWPAANAEVARIGGWRAYAREAASAASAPASGARP
jgi:hypothetical protein